MKRVLCFVLIAMAGILVGHAWGRSQTLPPGFQPYTPTKIEWLTLQLQADLRAERMIEDGYMLEISRADPNTVRIFVRYVPKADPAELNLMLKSARDMTARAIKEHGWGGWAKVSEDVQMLKQ